MAENREAALFSLLIFGGVLVFGGWLWAYPMERYESGNRHSVVSDSVRLVDCEGSEKSRSLNFSSSSKLARQNGVSPLLPSVGRPPSRFEMKFNLLANLPFSVADTASFPRSLKLSYSLNQTRIDYKRAALLGAGSAAYIYFGLKHAMDSWGKSNGRFHLKEDWTGDNLAQSDEISHFTWGYKMTQLCFWMYDWIGLSPKTGQLISMIESALILTIVEFPVDAYNPKQGLGVSDLIFDYMGVGFAFARKHQSSLQNLDVKVSWKRNLFLTNHPAFSQSFGEFDNFIFWLTYRPRLFFPQRFMCVGLGYSVTHRGIEPRREFYCGLGLSISDSFGLLGKRFKSYTRFLDLFYPNFKLKL